MGVEDDTATDSGGSSTTNYVSENGFRYSFSDADKATENAFRHLNAYIDNGGGLLGGESSWEAWIKGRYSHYDGDNDTFDGHIADLFGGIGMRVSPTVVVGVLAGYNDTGFDTLANAVTGALEATGFSVGIYTGIKLGGGYELDASVSYTGSDYDVRSGTTTGSFDADRITIAAHLRGRHQMGDWTIVPTIDFLWASEDQDAYTDSALVSHPSLRVEAGRISIGPKVLLPAMDASNGDHQYWVSAMGEYEFSDGSPSPASGLPDLSDIAYLRLAGGLDSRIGEGILTVRGDIFGIGSGEYIAYGGTVGYEIPF